jgi:hypothetical protein
MKTVFYFIIGFLTIPVIATAQHKEKDNQWWLGIKGGINQSNVLVLDRYDVFTYSEGQNAEKNYNFKYKKGYQIGLIGAWDFYKFFNLSFQPQLSKYSFDYESKNTWSDENNKFQITNYHNQQFQRVFLPLFLRYEFHFHKQGSHKDPHAKKHKSHEYESHSGTAHKSYSKFKPYLQIGYQYSILLSAQKSIVQQETMNDFKYAPTTDLFDIKNLLNQKNSAFILGGGMAYDLGGSFRVALDFNYQWDTDQMINQKNRYANEQLTLSYQDAFDDVKLRNWNASIHFLFPLKFVYSGNFKAL